MKILLLEVKNQLNKLNISLIPGNYSIKGFVMYGLPINIASEQICYKKGLFSGKKCQTIPGFNLKSWIIGGIEMDNFEVSVPHLLYKDKLVVPLVNYGIPHNFDDLSKMSNAMGDLKSLSVSKPIYFE